MTDGLNLRRKGIMGRRFGRRGWAGGGGQVERRGRAGGGKLKLMGEGPEVEVGAEQQVERSGGGGAGGAEAHAAACVSLSQCEGWAGGFQLGAG